MSAVTSPVPSEVSSPEINRVGPLRSRAMARPVAHYARGYLPTLDGWRAIAILAVIVDHGTGYRLNSQTALFHFTRVGPNGVSLFFAISGFLICSRLLEELSLCGRIDLWGFYIRRASRILPAAVTYLMVVGALGLMGLIAVSPVEWSSAAFFWRNYLPVQSIQGGWGGYTVHYWSLAVEEHFYLLWPACLACAGGKRARWIALAGAISISLWRWWDTIHRIVDRHLPGLIYGCRTDVRLDAILLGCLAAILTREASMRDRFSRKLAVPAFLIFAAAYAAIELVSHTHHFSIWESALLAAIVATTVRFPQTWFGRALETRPMKWMGRLSYSLYLWQQLFFLTDAKYPLSVFQKFPSNFVALFLVAYLSYRCIERPLIRWGHSLAPPPTPGRTDLASSSADLVRP